MSDLVKNPEHRYVNDLRRIDYIQRQAHSLRGSILAIGIAVMFLTVVALVVGNEVAGVSEGSVMIVCAAVIGAYMALNSGVMMSPTTWGPRSAARC